MTATAIAAHSVSRLFLSTSGPIWAIADVSLEVAEGEFVCLVGPSGCGKSTLLRILGNLDQASAGTVSLAAGDAPIPTAFVFQEYGTFPWATVQDNVTFGSRMAGIKRADYEPAAREWLRKVGLTDFAKAYPNQLSGGMRQRVQIARAFSTGSPVLLMDEPLGALDAQTRLLMQEQLMQLWEAERKTVVLVTHAIEEALLLGDRILVMSSRPGRIKEEITVPFARPRSMSVEADPRFAELRMHIWESLRDEVAAAEMA